MNNQTQTNQAFPSVTSFIANMNGAANHESLETPTSAARPTAVQVWAECDGLHAEHPLLKRLGISPFYARQTVNGDIVVPIYNFHEELISLKFISEDGYQSSLYCPDAKYGRLVLGDLGPGSDASMFYMCNSWFTACKLYASTNIPAVVCFDPKDRMMIHIDYLERLDISGMYVEDLELTYTIGN